MENERDCFRIKWQIRICRNLMSRKNIAKNAMKEKNNYVYGIIAGNKTERLKQASLRRASRLGFKTRVFNYSPLSQSTVFIPKTELSCLQRRLKLKKIQINESRRRPGGGRGGTPILRVRSFENRARQNSIRAIRLDNRITINTRLMIIRARARNSHLRELHLQWTISRDSTRIFLFRTSKSPERKFAQTALSHY